MDDSGLPPTSGPPPSLADLISDLASNLADLVRKESALVRAELSEKITVAGAAMAGLALAAVLLLGAFLAMLATIVLALSLVIAPIWACLIVAGGCGAFGLVALSAALNRLRPQALAPEHTIAQGEKIAHAAKELTR